MNLCHTEQPPFGRRPCDILVRVRAATLTRLDGRIAGGFGARFRRLVQSDSGDGGDATRPLPLGRGCAGVVEAVGAGARSGLEIGDEVWLAAAWWERGCATEVVVAPECRVARKPFIIGFEGAASLPYSGCVALQALERAGLDERTTAGRRVLVQDGCSPVGCVLTQLLRRWGAATVTATCSVRAVPVIKALGGCFAEGRGTGIWYLCDNWIGGVTFGGLVISVICIYISCLPSRDVIGFCVGRGKR